MRIAQTATEKKCSGCGVSKPLTEFHRRRDKYAPLCRPCANEYARNRYRANREKECGRFAKYAAENRESVLLAYRRSRLKQKYGITLEEYGRLLGMQNGVCAICRQEEVTRDHRGKLRELAVDHDHITGKVRGLLCNQCNNMLGRAKDSVTILQAAIDYLSGSEEELLCA